jgi:hypothetical protein
MLHFAAQFTFYFEIINNFFISPMGFFFSMLLVFSDADLEVFQLLRQLLVHLFQAINIVVAEAHLRLQINNHFLKHPPLTLIGTLLILEQLLHIYHLRLSLAELFRVLQIHLGLTLAHRTFLSITNNQSCLLVTIHFHIIQLPYQVKILLRKSHDLLVVLLNVRPVLLIVLKNRPLRLV